MKQSTNRGYSLLELLVATSILLVVSALSFIVLQSSNESNLLSAAKEEVSGDLRNTLLAVTSEVRSAYTERTVESDPPLAPEEAFSIEVREQGKELRFTVPEPRQDSALPLPSSPIVIRFENEDAEPANGMLDSGEDTNGDGSLTRRLVRVQDDQTTVIGAANNISDVTFELEPNPAEEDDTRNVLIVRLAGSKVYGPGEDKKHVQAAVESRIRLEN